MDKYVVGMIIVVKYNRIKAGKDCMMKITNDNIDKKAIEHSQRFDNVIDDGWIVNNTFSDWIPSLFYNKENHQLVISMENLVKDSVAFNYKDSNLVISAIDFQKKGNKNKIKPGYIRRIYNLKTPVLANNIYIKCKDGCRYLKSKDKNINLSFVKIEINIPQSGIIGNFLLQ